MSILSIHVRIQQPSPVLAICDGFLRLTLQAISGRNVLIPESAGFASSDPEIGKPVREILFDDDRNALEEVRVGDRVAHMDLESVYSFLEAL